jgi:hypothetical protein
MTRSPGVLPSCVRVAHWALPWMCSLALSASLAYATNAALTSVRFTPEPQPRVSTTAAWARLTAAERPDTIAGERRRDDSCAADTCLTTFSDVDQQ